MPDRGIGGGISQFSTTLYNATYFAGLDEVEHKEHSYYISRYPAGREATVFDGVIDLKFRNDGDHADPHPDAVDPVVDQGPDPRAEALRRDVADRAADQPGPRRDARPRRQPEVQALQGRRRLHDHRHAGAQGRDRPARRSPSPGPCATTRSPRSPATGRPAAGERRRSRRRGLGGQCRGGRPRGPRRASPGSGAAVDGARRPREASNCSGRVGLVGYGAGAPGRRGDRGAGRPRRPLGERRAGRPAGRARGDRRASRFGSRR